MFKGISSAISFLTIIPYAKNTDLEMVAKNMYLFPVVGAIIGLIIGAGGFGLSSFLDPWIVGLLLTGSLAIITGIHHTDALGDFADGIMAKGTKEKKIQVMRDPVVGSAGVITIVLYAGGMIIALSMMKGFELFQAILLSEILAKFVMVLQANRGSSAWNGMGSPFTQSMKEKKKLFIATVISLIPIIVIGGITGVIVIVAGVILSLVILSICHRSFGGVSGDVFGATNELVRLSSLLIFASI